MNKDKKKIVDKLEVLRHPYQLTANFIKWKFTPGENRILIRLLQRIKVNQELKKELQIDFNGLVSMKFHWKDLMLENSHATSRLKEDLKCFREKSILLPSTMIVKGKVTEAELLTGLITEAKWDKHNSHVELKLNESWYQFLIDLSSGFTEYNSLIAYKLNTSYSIKMYYFICHWYRNGGKTLTLEQFRKEFDIPNNIYTTKTASRFIERVLKPSKEVLDKLSDKSFNFSPIKTGRSITGFSIAFYDTKNEKATIIDWHDVNKFLDFINEDFSIDKTQRARISGLIKKYSFPTVKHFYRMQKHVVYDYVASGLTTVDAISKGLVDYNIDPIQINVTPSNN